jgi:3-dehydroquinate dehydratase / shikimate dehydrogenase
MIRPRLCATVTGATTADLRARRDAIRDAEMVELRIDSVVDPDVNGALEGRRLPVILTCRPTREGGGFGGSEDERRRLLRAAVESDAEYVDLEWNAGLDDLVRVRSGKGIILSTHDFDGVPADLSARAHAMARSGAEVVKIAVSASRLTDCVRLLDLSRTLQGRRAVVLGMGDAGLATRVFAARLGNPWSYAGDGVAPGQVSVARMVREFTFQRIQADTVLYGLAGRPVAHSVSPALHNAGFADLGVNAAYIPLAAFDLDDFATFAEAFDLAGASVTAPFKSAAMSLLSSCTDTARAAGAINTLVRRDGGFAGANTDEAGFLAPLAGEGFDTVVRRNEGFAGVSIDAGGVAPPRTGEGLDGVRVAVLGHGGAARAVAWALKPLGARVTLYGRGDGTRARAVAAELGVLSAARPVPPGSWDILVNATPVGTFPHADKTPYPEAQFDGRLVYDLVYNPLVTRLQRDGVTAGCRVIGGLDMLVSQAQMQQEIWLGKAPSLSVLRDAAVWKLSAFASDP